MANPRDIPEFLRGNIPLQRRYFAALRSKSGGCNSDCGRASTIRKFQKLALQQQAVTERLAGKSRKR